MAKAYNHKWTTKMLTVNFNQKQWRQDFGAFVRNKLFWDGTTMVTRSRGTNNGNKFITKGIRAFEVYNGYGGSVYVEYQNENEIITTSHEELLKEYLEGRLLK